MTTSKKTETELKLQDAGTQMRLAISNAASEEVFRSCINAYLATSRSVTMVMEKESADFGQPLLDWYKHSIQPFAEAPFFKFFNSQRVHSVHRGVVHPTKQVFRTAHFCSEGDVVNSSASDVVHHLEVLSECAPANEGDVLSLMPDGTMVTWVFDEFKDVWPHHSGNVLALCEMHFLALKRLVLDWLAQKASISER